MGKFIKIFDTTLRDGEQSPGASMNTDEKIKIALQLQKLGVDIIEAGFAKASPGDFEAIERIASVIDKSTICSLARAVDADIKDAGEAIKAAKKRRIHTFIATSPIHMEYKLKMAPDEVVKRAVKAVEYAKTFKGRRQLVWSRGLKELAGIKERSDERLAEDEVRRAEAEANEMVMGTFDKAEWKTIRPSRAQILQAAEHGPAELGRFVKRLWGMGGTPMSTPDEAVPPASPPCNPQGSQDTKV